MKKQKKRWLIWLIGTAPLLLSACAQVKIKDEELCADFGDDGASCVHTMNDQKRDIAKGDWDIERFGEICVQSQAIADWKAELEELCSISNRCTYDQKEAIRLFFVRLNEMQSPRR